MKPFTFPPSRPPARVLGFTVLSLALCAMVGAAPAALADDPPAPLTASAQPDSDTTQQNVPITTNVLDNDVPADMPDGTPGSFVYTSLTFPNVGQPDTATVSSDGTTITVAGEGTYTVVTGRNSRGNILFTPLQAYRDATTTPVTYSVSDNQGNVVSSTLTETVVGSNPFTTDDSVSTLFGHPAILAAVTDDHGSTAAPLMMAESVFPATPQAAGAVISTDGKTLTLPNVGVWTMNADGTVTFIPGNFAGLTPLVYYQVTDANGTTATARLQVHVGRNDTAQPVHVTTPYRTNVAFSVLTHDVAGTDASGNPATIVPASTYFPSTGQGPSAVVSSNNKVLTMPNEGTFILGTTGVVTFVPTATFVGVTPTYLAYTVVDSAGNHDTSNLGVQVYAPGSVTSASTSVAHGHSVALALSSHFTPAGGTTRVNYSYCVIPSTLRVNIKGHVTAPSKSTTCTTSLTITNVGKWTVGYTGTMTFTASSKFIGTTSMTWHASDSGKHLYAATLYVASK